MKQKKIAAIIVIIIIIILIAATLNYSSQPGMKGPKTLEQKEAPITMKWNKVYAFNKEGYEPSISSDSTGTMYYTAHKNLDDKSSWDYLASWFFVSKDNGESWNSPTEPFPRGAYWQTFLGDEGDIAVDGRDNVYFVDTYLVDNHIHVWADQGQYQYSVRVQKTTGLDDRPWISAQGDQIVHYLGNNAVEVGGGRYWYYRSDDGARTFTAGEPVPGNGWGLIDAERDGDHVFIISETDVGTEADIVVYVSDDTGRTWDWNNPTVIAHRNGSGRQYPVITYNENGIVWALWNLYTPESTATGNRIFAARSLDYGSTWEWWDISPFEKAFYDYPTINSGPNGAVGVAFYATKDLPIDENSEWYVYGGMQYAAINGTPELNFTVADPHVTYVGDNLHALHDFFEIVITPDMALNIAYQYYIGPNNGRSDMYFVRGELDVPGDDMDKNGSEKDTRDQGAGDDREAREARREEPPHVRLI